MIKILLYKFSVYINDMIDMSVVDEKPSIFQLCVFKIKLKSN